MSFDQDNEDRRRAIALFREKVLADLGESGMPRGEISAYIAKIASQSIVLPDGTERRFSERTLWSWWSAYRKQGLTGLLPRERSDKGLPREITPELLAAAIEKRKEIPSRSTATIIDILEREKVVSRDQLRRSTLDRHLEHAGHSRRRLRSLGDKRYIRMLFERPNQFWVGDYHEAPILFDPKTGKFRTVHLSAFIDHYSKFVPHGQWYTNERLATLEDTFKKAALKRGLPDTVYVDNGSVYRSDAFAFALAQFHIRLCHSKAYRSEGRGVIERFNRTVAEQFEPEARAARIVELDRLNLFFEGWLEERYHREKHGSTGQPPLDRYAQEGFTPRWADPVLVADTFRVRVSRKVHSKTSTVEVGGVPFLVENFLRGRWVRVYYDPHCLEDILVYLNRTRVQRAFVAKPNERPQPVPERPTAAPPRFDYLAALRADYDRRIVQQARHLSLADWTPEPAFSLAAFLILCAQMLGKDLSPYEAEDLTLAFQTVGPFSERTCRLALEHGLKLRGRGLHVSVYSHYLRTFHLAAMRELAANNQNKENS
ncbi:MAG: DDE-type integrase/transposase/recombinase [Chloroflexota bacterium]